MTEQLKVTSPEEYAALVKPIVEAERADPGELVTLPKTKAVVRLRRVDLEGEALTGGIPLSLVAAARDVTTEAEEADVAAERISEEDMENAAENVKGLIFMRQTVVENCLEPKIGQDVTGRVCFMSEGRAIARVHKADFLYMFDWISGQEGNDGLKRFRNRKERRASASQSRSKALRPRSVGANKGQPASA
jgi:hypothetical protein